MDCRLVVLRINLHFVAFEYVVVVFVVVDGHYMNIVVFDVVVVHWPVLLQPLV